MQMKMWIKFLLSFHALVAVGLVGCSGGSSVETYDVSGTVTYNGQPVANVGVTFIPDGGGLAATGRTDAEGKFDSLTTRESGDGVAEGNYIVTLSTIIETSTETITDVSAYSVNAGGPPPFPTRYLNATESDLRCSVGPDGERELSFALTD